MRQTTGDMPALPAQPSPKRKRDHGPPVPAPLLTTALALRPAPPQHRPVPADSGDISRQLQDIDLDGTALAPPDPAQHKKKPKLDGGTALDTAAATTIPTREKNTQAKSAAVHTVELSDVRSRAPNKPRSPPPSLFTWKDGEMAGPAAGPAIDPDDDGTGLNGIGFKPTPALAYARSQKRRQQLSEWKRRETREARAKRSQRRQRGVAATPSSETTIEGDMPIQQVHTPKRSVKFAI